MAYAQLFSSEPMVGVSGIIGAGKTEVAKRLAEHYGWKVIHEPVLENPYLDLFYRDQEKYAFAMQVFLLSQRFRLHQGMIWPGNKGAVQDRTIYEDPIFAMMLYRDGKISELDFRTYSDLYTAMLNFLHQPRIIIFLRVSPEKAMKRIAERGRKCEEGIPIEYLRRLDAGYKEWRESKIQGIKVVEIDWEDDHFDLTKLTSVVDAELGLVSP